MPQLHQGEARKGVLSLDLYALGQHQKEIFLPHLLALPQRIHTQDGQANYPLKQHQVSLRWYMILSAPNPLLQPQNSTVWKDAHWSIQRTNLRSNLRHWLTLEKEDNCRSPSNDTREGVHGAGLGKGVQAEIKSQNTGKIHTSTKSTGILLWNTFQSEKSDCHIKNIVRSTYQKKCTLKVNQKRG